MSDILLSAVDEALGSVEQALARYAPGARHQEVGRIIQVGAGVAWAEGLGSVRYEELLTIGNNITGVAMEILADRVGIALLNEPESPSAGMEVARTNQVLNVPVGRELFGRVIDPSGNPRDGKGPVREEDRWPIHQTAPGIMDRAPVSRPLLTGLKVIDALIPIGRGQRELILGDRQTGKTAIAVDAIINQRGKNVLCVYCSIAQRSSSLARVVADLRRHDALDYTAVVVVDGEDPPGLKYVAPYAATSVAEYFRNQGRDVLIVYDDLTQHARAYRQLSLLLRRPPGREAYPGDIFFIHSRLLERATHLKPELGGGSLTALPIIETEAQNISAYIPTNLISITDGQVYVSPDLFIKSILPAVDVGMSVSRVGGKSQLPGYRKVGGPLRLSYTQYQELETFARFGTRLEERTRKRLEHGRRVREILKQNQFNPLSAGEQVAVLFAVAEGLLDDLPMDRIRLAQERIIGSARERWPNLDEDIAGATRDAPVWDELREHLRTALESLARP